MTAPIVATIKLPRRPPLTDSPNVRNKKPPINAPTTPTTMSPTAPKLLPLINRPASHPAASPIKINHRNPIKTAPPRATAPARCAKELHDDAASAIERESIGLRAFPTRRRWSPASARFPPCLLSTVPLDPGHRIKVCTRGPALAQGGRVQCTDRRYRGMVLATRASPTFARRPPGSWGEPPTTSGVGRRWGVEARRARC